MSDNLTNKGYYINKQRELTPVKKPLDYTTKLKLLWERSKSDRDRVD